MQKKSIIIILPFLIFLTNCEKNNDEKKDEDAKNEVILYSDHYDSTGTKFIIFTKN